MKAMLKAVDKEQSRSAVMANTFITYAGIFIILFAVSFDTLRSVSTSIYEAMFPVVRNVEIHNIRQVSGGIIADFKFEKLKPKYTPQFPFAVLLKTGERKYIYKTDFPIVDQKNPIRRPTGLNYSRDWPFRGLYSVCNIQSIVIEHKNEETGYIRESVFWTPEHYKGCNGK